MLRIFFFLTDTATTAIYTLSLHDALPISDADDAVNYGAMGAVIGHEMSHAFDDQGRQYDEVELTALVVERSEEHTSELQSHHDLVCRLLLEKKKKIKMRYITQKPNPTYPV